MGAVREGGRVIRRRRRTENCDLSPFSPVSPTEAKSPPHRARVHRRRAVVSSQSLARRQVGGQIGQVGKGSWWFYVILYWDELKPL